MEPEALRLVAKAATGSLRDAENLLEQLTTYYGSDIGLHQVQAILGITGDFRTKELVKHIINNDVSAGVTTINSVNSDGLDLKQFNRELVEYLRGLLLIKTDSDAAVDLTAEDIAELKELARRASLSQILKAVKLFGQLELGFDNYSTLPLELALIDCTLTSEEEGGSPTSQTEDESRQPIKAATPSYPEQPTAKPEPAIVPPPAVPEAAATITPLAVPETAATITPPEPGSELDQLRLNWKQVVAQAPEDTKKTPAIAILRSAGVKPVAFEDNTVVLAFRYPLHKEKMGEPENQQVAEKIISNFLGRPCRVRCIYEPEDNHLVQEAQRMGAQVTSVEEK
jgi:DNA polymerase-3 subunit gamma/tau